jgi:hypothetical protein
MPRRVLLLLVACLCIVPVADAAGGTDLAIAKRAQLRLSDLPIGWSQSAGTSTRSGCFDGPVQANSPTAYVQSGKFQNSTNVVNASSSVAVFANAAAARRALVGLSNRSVFTCYAKALAKVLPSGGATLSSFDGGPLVFGRVGDRVRAFRYGAAIKKGTASGTITFDYVFVVRGRVLISGGFVDEAAPLATADERGVFAKVIARV